MSLHLLTGPAAEPLHIAEVRQHCKVDITDDDALLGIYLAAARQHAEQQTRRQIVAARWALVLDRFPNPRCDSIRIPMGPVRRIVSVEYLNPDGLWTALFSTDYVAELDGEPARVAPAYGLSWPSVRPQQGAVRISFDAGYVAPCAADAAADTVAVQGWPALAAGDLVRFSNSGGALPEPLQPHTDYAIAEAVAAGVYTLAASPGGPAIDIATAGTGQHYLGQSGPGDASGEIPFALRSWLLLRCDSLYSHRGETAVVRTGQLMPLPYVDRLLDPHRLLSV